MCKFRTLKPEEIDIRVGNINSTTYGTYASYLLYKDARVDMNILDETVGPMNWKKEYSRDNQNCTVSIYDQEKKEWISLTCKLIIGLTLPFFSLTSSLPRLMKI